MVIVNWSDDNTEWQQKLQYTEVTVNQSKSEPKWQQLEQQQTELEWQQTYVQAKWSDIKQNDIKLGKLEW